MDGVEFGGLEQSMLATRPLACPFGPEFFVSHLGRFVRDCCPAPGEDLPSVRLVLHGGETLELCHVVAFSMCWIALAVVDPEAPGAHRMRTDIVPYPTIARVIVSRSPAREGLRGFESQPSTAPGRQSAERLLEAARNPSPEVPDSVTWLDTQAPGAGGDENA